MMSSSSDETVLAKVTELLHQGASDTQIVSELGCSKLDLIRYKAKVQTPKRKPKRKVAKRRLLKPRLDTDSVANDTVQIERKIHALLAREIDELDDSLQAHAIGECSYPIERIRGIEILRKMYADTKLNHMTSDIAREKIGESISSSVLSRI